MNSWAGCHTRKSSATDINEMSADNASVSSGPTKFDTVNWPIAKLAPAVSAAGHTSIMRRHPAYRITRYAGMINEKSGN